MAVGGVYVSSNYNFGSLESIRKQAKEIADRVEKQSAARKEEQEKTGLIENREGVMVEISSLTEKQVESLNHWHDVMLVSPEEAMIGFLATAPHSDEVEEDKQRAARMTKIQDKMLTGQKLTNDEKSFMREFYPEMAAKAEQMEQLAEQVTKRLQNSKSKKESQQIYMEEKMNIVSQLDPKDGSALFLIAAIDNAYAEHNGRKNSAFNIDIFA